MTAYFTRLFEHVIDPAMPTAEEYMATNYKGVCIKNHADDANIIKCLKKTKYANYVNETETSTAVQLKSISKKFFDLCHNLFPDSSDSFANYNLKNCLSITGNLRGNL